jgi:DDE superfamily endonuclease
MPRLPLRRQLLDQLDDADRTFKRARLSKYLQNLSAESLLRPTGDEERDGSEISSISSFSSFSTFSSNDSDGITDIEDMYIEAAQARVDALRELVHASRVLRKHPPIKKSSQLHLLEHWRNDNLDQYRRKVRVDPNTFDGIVDKIRNDDSFYNDSNVPQAPVEVQLAIFLYRAGHYGNAASPEAIGQWAGVSPGTVVNCTNRVMMALLALHDEYVHFPTAEEKESAKAWVEEKVCPEWRDGYLMVDGTKLPLFQRPGLHGDAWFDKNRSYSLDCQVRSHVFVCCNLTCHQLTILPDSLIIMDYGLGHTGSVHDSTAFRNTLMFKEHERILAPGEWIWADSAYPAETWCVSPFRKPPGGELSRDQRTFNYHVSKVSQHSIFLFVFLMILDR